MEVVKNIDKNHYKIMCFSDIHGNKEALEALLEETRKLKVDEVICLGDTISKGPESDECLHLIKKENIVHIAGNNEYFVINGVKEGKTKKEIEHINWVKKSLPEENIEYIKSLPTKYVINFKEANMQFAHFLFGENEEFVNLAYLYERGVDSNILKNNQYDYVFFGHKHIPGIEAAGEYNYFAVGSSGCTRCEFTHYLLISYDKGKVEVKRVKIPYDSETFSTKLRESSYPNKETYMRDLFDIK